MKKQNFNPIIQTTYNYGQFKNLHGNRSINVPHKMRLKQSMQEDPLLSLIMVNERNEIIDGQHRFEVCKELNLPINYVIVYGYGMKEVQILNVNSTNWKKIDYLESHAKNGLPNYITFKKFMSDFPQLNFSTCLKCLSGLSNSDGEKASIGGVFVTSKRFENGELKIPNLKKSYEVANKILDYRPFFAKFNDNTFVITLLYLFKHPNYNHLEMLKKLKNQPTAISGCKSQNQYVIMLEEIYNYKRRPKVSLRY